MRGRAGESIHDPIRPASPGDAGFVTLHEAGRRVADDPGYGAGHGTDVRWREAVPAAGGHKSVNETSDPECKTDD